MGQTTNTQTLESGSPAVCDIFADRAREVTEFCLNRGGKAFEGWAVPTLFAYVFFHLVDRTCFVVRQKGEIAGVLFAQALDEAEQRQRVALNGCRFNWTRSFDRPTDAIALREVVARQDLLPRLAKQVSGRWPDWRERKVFTFRNGALVELRPAVIERFLGGNESKSKIKV